MRKDQGCLGWIEIPVPVRDKLRDRFHLQLRTDHPSICPIGIDRPADMATRQIKRGITHPLLALTIDGFKFGIANAIGNRPEGGTGFDRLQLFRIANQDEFGAGFGDGLNDQCHLPR
tara:strand:- start:18 stop:368 length:351 start_codon:yes stop_codon:yes gene_type:complete